MLAYIITIVIISKYKYLKLITQYLLLNYWMIENY